VTAVPAVPRKRGRREGTLFVRRFAGEMHRVVAFEGANRHPTITPGMKRNLRNRAEDWNVAGWDGAFTALRDPIRGSDVIEGRFSVITILVHDSNTFTIERLLSTAPELSDRIRFLTYKKVFARREAPIGTLVFTDFDLLHAAEVDAAAVIANAGLAASPGCRIINHPAFTKERVPLLAHLHKAGLNPIEVTRLDTGEMPSRYPVFIRSEDGCGGPESRLLHDRGQLRQELDSLAMAGKTLKRRIAVTFEAQPDRNGYFRKYGAFVIGKRIIPQHLLRNEGWNVKSSIGLHDPSFAAEEEAYVKDNPHEAHLLRISAFAGIEFGRIDYTLVNGDPVIFEINTNPTFPRFAGGDPAREGRRPLILDRLRDAFAEIDMPVATPSTFTFNTSLHIHRNLAGADLWFNDLPYSLYQKRRWMNLLQKLGLRA
jgi:hypothetical protein